MIVQPGGLGGIYIFPRENFKEMEQDTQVWVHTLI